MGSNQLSPARDREPGRFEAWVIKNSSWLALGIIFAAFALRLAYSDSCYLNPDEAAHFEAARPGSWLETCKAAFGLAHPPLFILVLHGDLFLGRTELMLRLPSLICGTAALWLAFAWLRRNLGAIPALAGLGFMALSPSAIAASTEVRQYGLLLFFICGALYATERTFTERSTAWAVVQGLCLVGALLTHYTSIVVIFSIGSYVLLRLLSDGAPRRVLFTMGVCQLVLITLLGLLYFGHVRHSIPFGSGTSMDYLRSFYYTPARETPLGFVWRAFSRTFSYAFGFYRLAPLFILAFLAGLTALVAGRTKAPRLMAVLIICPFAVGFVAAVFHVFPFAGTRHQTYLLPFFAAGIAAVLACMPARRALLLLLLGAVIAPFWATRAMPSNNPRAMPIGDMTAAIKYLRQMVPPGAGLFVDYETRFQLRYYFTRNDASFDILRTGTEVEEQLGGYRVVVPKKFVWDFDPGEALEQAAESARASGVPPGDPLWVFSVAWGDPSLGAQLTPGADHEVKDFGRISVIRVLGQKH